MRNTMYTGDLFSVQMRTSKVKKAVYVDSNGEYHYGR